MKKKKGKRPPTKEMSSSMPIDEFVAVEDRETMGKESVTTKKKTRQTTGKESVTRKTETKKSESRKTVTEKKESITKNMKENSKGQMSCSSKEIGNENRIKLRIRSGGNTSKKDNEEYEYIGEIGKESVFWKVSEIRWNRFEEFVSSEFVGGSVGLIWYKRVSQDMKIVRYVLDNTDYDMGELIKFGIEEGEVDVWIEHSPVDMTRSENEVLYLPSSQKEDLVSIRSNVEEDEHDDFDDRPREEDEPEQSGDEKELDDEEKDGNEADNEAENEDGIEAEIQPENQTALDDGYEVLKYAGDGHDDVRFLELFEEGMGRKVNPKEAYGDQEEDLQDEDSEHEFGLGNGPYPDTPLETDEEWDKWEIASKSKGKEKFHGSFEDEPYIWLFQKFNSGLEFKDQLLKYSLKTQYDVKMAKTEANRIAVVCNTKNCPWRVYCSVEIPINKWMVKVCQMKHNHVKSSRVSMLKQGVIAGLFREELRRNVGLTANEIKDTIKAKYEIIVPLSKCFKGRRIALDSILETQAVQFSKLWDYEAELKRSNPGTTTEILTVPINGVQVFDCFYICFEPLRRTWKSCCRPVIGLDGCFLKWELTGDLLAAVGRGADN